MAPLWTKLSWTESRLSWTRDPPDSASPVLKLKLCVRQLSRPPTGLQPRPSRLVSSGLCRLHPALGSLTFHTHSDRP